MKLEALSVPAMAGALANAGTDLATDRSDPPLAGCVRSARFFLCIAPSGGDCGETGIFCPITHFSADGHLKRELCPGGQFILVSVLSYTQLNIFLIVDARATSAWQLNPR
jgi:hypothetical protein